MSNIHRISKKNRKKGESRVMMKKVLLASIFAVGISAFLTVPELNAQTPAKAAEKTVKSEKGWMTDFAAAQKDRKSVV